MKPITRLCGICKEPIELRDDNPDIDNIILIDSRFYHRDCYERKNEVRKRCYWCKKDIVYSGESNNDVLFENHYYHDKCFDKWCRATKRKSIKREKALSEKEQYIHDADAELKKLDEQRNHYDPYKANRDARKEIRRMISERELNSYIKYEYNIPSISGRIWQRLNQCYNGSYKDIEYRVSPEYLLDMWRRRQNDLDVIYSGNIVRGNDMSNEDRVIYDLAILMSQYPSYIEWLRKEQKRERNSFSNGLGSVSFRDVDYIEKVENNAEKPSDKDISGVIDDMFKEE